MSSVRVLVVDDHALFRCGVAALLAGSGGVQVVGQAGDALDAVRKAQALHPDVILLDNRVKGATPVRLLACLKEVAPDARIVLMAPREDEHDLHVALGSGARGYLLKTIDADGLTAAIHKVMRGESVISPQLMGRLVAGLRSPAPAPPPIQVAPNGGNALSRRELEVLRHIARGASNKEIARTLEIAETTVKIHVQHILRKLGVNSRVQAAVMVTSGSLRA
jgi:two-component system, NarL family, nitrate/nitrite response regulator NarL